jgi:hypothetical protein
LSGAFEAERAAIEGRFNTQWASRTGIKYENADCKPTANDWVSIAIVRGNSDRASLGTSPLYRHIGIISISIFTPLKTGTKAAVEHAEVIDGIFREATFNNITCRVPSIKNAANFNGWYRLNVTIPYFRNET